MGQNPLIMSYVTDQIKQVSKKENRKTFHSGYCANILMSFLIIFRPLSEVMSHQHIENLFNSVPHEIKVKSICSN